MAVIVQPVEVIRPEQFLQWGWGVEPKGVLTFLQTDSIKHCLIF